MPNRKIFQPIDNEDIIEDVKKVVTGFFTGNNGKLVGGNLVTKSLSTAQKNYYYNMQYSSEDQLSVTFGHIGGSGSNGSNGSVSNLKGETEAIYKSFASQLLPAADAHSGFVFHSGSNSGTTFNGATAFINDGKKPEPGMYFVVAERARMKDRIDKGSWTIILSGSNETSGTAGINNKPTHLGLTDNSEKKDVFPDASPAGPRYDIVSGSAGTVINGDKVYGWFYPNIGVWALRESMLSASIRGNAGYITGSGIGNAGWNHYGSGLAMDTTISSVTDNALKIAKAISLGTHTLRAQEDQAITSYFCRARAHQFNGTTNPTFISGSDGRLLNRTMEGDPQVFVTTVGLYDENYELVMVGRLSSPVQKNWSTEATFKTNLTW